MNNRFVLAVRSVGSFFVRYWKQLSAVLVFVVALAIGGLALVPPPTAQGAEKGHEVQIYRNAHMQAVFSQMMDHSSVERAFTITPAINGSFSWKGNVLTFKPAADLEKGTKYVVEIGEGAVSVYRKHLTAPFRQTYSVLDYPEVAVVAPVNNSEIRTSQTLTVLFDHPIRNLTRSLEVPEMLKIEPAVVGKYHWLGTSGFEFIPTNGWTPATDFTVTIPKGTKTADGGSTIADYVWKFSTPRVTVSLVSRMSSAYPADPFLLEFNYPVDPAVVASSLVIRDGSSTMPNDQFAFTKAKNNPNQVVVQKKERLHLGTVYSISLPQGYTANLGQKGLETEFNAKVAMDDAMFAYVKARSYGTDLVDGKKRALDPLDLVFNNMPDEKTFANNITITPELSNFEARAYDWGDQGRIIQITGRWKASTAYKITLSSGLKDLYGQPLQSTKPIEITTLPYEPSSAVSSYSQYGMLDSYLPRLYQVRTLNVVHPVSAVLCSGTFEQYISSKQTYSCEIKANKTYDVTGPQNQYHISDMDLDDLAGRKLPNGFYQLGVHVPDIRNSTGADEYTRALVISDVSLTLKRDNDNKLLVWATDMKTGDVVPNLTVEAWTMPYQSQPRKLVQGTTDAQGLAMLDVSKATQEDYSLAVQAYGGAHLGFANTGWSDGISPWNYALNVSSRQAITRQIGYVYTDRRIYRSDQLVYFKGVLRKDIDAALSIPDQSEVHVDIQNPDGEVVQSFTLPVSEYGTFHGAFQLDPSMNLGTYSIVAKNPEAKYDYQNVSGSFDVREYRRPDFKVTVQTPEGMLLSGQKIDIPVHAEYYFGGALAGAKVSYEVTRNALYFQPMKGEWYSFTNTDNTSDCYWYCSRASDFENVMSGEGVLDDQGNLIVTVPANLTDYKTSANYNVTVTVTDLNQRTVSYNTGFPVHKGDVYVGIRPDYSKGWNSPTADFNVTTVNPDGSKHSNVAVTVKLYRRTWTSVKKEQTGGSSYYDYEKKDELVDTKSATTNNEAKADFSFAVKNDGEYVAIVEAQDTRGSQISASANLYIYRGFGSTVRVSDDHQMKIVQNKAEYAPGETASMIVQTPYQRTKALVSVEREKIREYRVIDLDNKTRVVEVPITDDSTPNVYVSVLAVQGGGDTGIPEFKLGYAELRVNTSKKVLSLAVTPDRKTYKPGDTVTLNVTTKRNDGVGVPAEVSIAVVDERVVALLGSIDKDILGKFWFERSIGVTTAQSLTQLVKKVFFATEGGAGDGKGGGGEKVIPVRGNFRDTAYWKADVVTDANGNGAITFNLPDNLTSWQILSIGETKDTIVGSAETQIVTRKDLMVEPLVPRILRYNDTVQLGATVFNQTGASMTVKTSFEAAGLNVDGPAERSISLAPNGRAAVNWTVHVPYDVTSTKVTVRASGNGLDDGFVVPVPVLSYSVPETVTASGFLEKTATENIEKPDDILPDKGEVKVSVSPNVGNGLSGGLKYLVEFEYGCSEQTTSAILSSLVYEELVKQKITPSDAELLQKAQAKVTEGIKRLVALQNPDGGFGWWAVGDRSYAHLTAYVFWGLTQAQKAGYPVDSQVLDHADAYLRDALSRPGDYGYDSLNINEKAQVLFMLSERDPHNLAGYAAGIYDKRASLASYSKAFLAMAIANLESNVSSARVATLLGEIRNKVVYLDPTRAYVGEDQGYSQFLSTDVRSTSLYLQALLRLDPKHGDVERTVHWLMTKKRNGYWQTTQDTAMTMLALVNYAKKNPVDTTANSVTVYIDSAVKGSLVFSQGDVSAEQNLTIPLSQVLKNDTTQIGLEKDSDKRYFYDISMKVYRQIDNIQPFDNGFTVLSDTYALDDKKFEHPLSQVKQGDTVRVRVRLLVPKHHDYVALEDHLPAGLEAIDFQLKTSPQNIAGLERQCVTNWSGQLDCMDQEGWEYRWWWQNVWKHIELRDDRVFLFSEGLEPGVYEYSFLAQAVTPGEFRVPPARAYEFYNPNANGHNEGKIMKVIAK